MERKTLDTNFANKCSALYIKVLVWNAVVAEKTECSSVNKFQNVKFKKNC